MPGPDPDEKPGVERMLREALQALALSAEDQARLCPGACLPCELYGEFAHWSECYARVYFPDTITAQQRDRLAEVMRGLDEVAATEDYRCWDREAIRTSGRWA